jgi:hypothetical protein
LPRVDLQIAQAVQVHVVIAQQIVQGPALALQGFAHARFDRFPSLVGHGMRQRVADVLDAAVRIADALPFFLQLDRLVAVFRHLALDKEQPRSKLGDIRQLFPLVAQHQPDGRGQSGGLHLLDRIALSPPHVVERLGFGLHFAGNIRQFRRQIRPLFGQIGVALSQFFQRGIDLLPGTFLFADLPGFLDLGLGHDFALPRHGVLPGSHGFLQVADAALDQVALERHQLGHRIQTATLHTQCPQTLVQRRQLGLGLRAVSQRGSRVFFRRRPRSQTGSHLVQLLVRLVGQAHQFAPAVADTDPRLAGRQFFPSRAQLILMLIQNLLQLLDRGVQAKTGSDLGQRLFQLLARRGDLGRRLLDFAFQAAIWRAVSAAASNHSSALAYMLQQVRFDGRLQLRRRLDDHPTPVQLGRRQEPHDRIVRRRLKHRRRRVQQR